jgi:WD40 repeat protein
LAVVQSNAELSLRKVETGKLVNSVPRVDYAPGEAAFSPDGRILATTGAFGLSLYSVPKLQVLARMRSDANQLAFSPDSKLLALATAHGAVRLYDATTGRAVGGVLGGFGPELADLAYAPDGRLLGVDETGRVMAWDSLLAQDRLEPWRRRLCWVTAANLSSSGWRQYLGTEPRRATCPARD